MGDDHPAALAVIDRAETELRTLVDGLRSDDVITDDDAAEFDRRAETIGAELRACVECATAGPFDGGDDEC